MMYHLSYLDIKHGGGVKLTPPPPSVSWFSSTPAGIGLSCEREIESLVIKNYAFEIKNRNKFYLTLFSQFDNPFFVITQKVFELGSSNFLDFLTNTCASLKAKSCR